MRRMLPNAYPSTQSKGLSEVSYVPVIFFTFERSISRMVTRCKRCGQYFRHSRRHKDDTVPHSGHSWKYLRHPWCSNQRGWCDRDSWQVRRGERPSGGFYSSPGRRFNSAMDDSSQTTGIHLSIYCRGDHRMELVREPSHQLFLTHQNCHYLGALSAAVSAVCLHVLFYFPVRGLTYALQHNKVGCLHPFGFNRSRGFRCLQFRGKQHCQRNGSFCVDIPLRDNRNIEFFLFQCPEALSIGRAGNCSWHYYLFPRSNGNRRLKSVQALSGGCPGGSAGQFSGPVSLCL